MGEGRRRERAAVTSGPPDVPRLVHAPLARDSTPNAATVEPAQPPRVMGPDAVYFEFQVEEPVHPVAGFRGPRYPAEARAGRREGDVLAQFVVDTSGAVESSTFRVLASTAPEFTEAVRAALGTMRFRPARVGGLAVKQLVQQPFAFDLTR
jgi:TonB family protein